MQQAIPHSARAGDSNAHEVAYWNCGNSTGAGYRGVRSIRQSHQAQHGRTNIGHSTSEGCHFSTGVFRAQSMRSWSEMGQFAASVLRREEGASDPRRSWEAQAGPSRLAAQTPAGPSVVHDTDITNRCLDDLSDDQMLHNANRLGVPYINTAQRAMLRRINANDWQGFPVFCHGACLRCHSLDNAMATSSCLRH